MTSYFLSFLGRGKFGQNKAVEEESTKNDWALSKSEHDTVRGRRLGDILETKLDGNSLSIEHISNATTTKPSQSLADSSSLSQSSVRLSKDSEKGSLNATTTARSRTASIKFEDVDFGKRKISHSFTGTRMKSLFHRIWFIENQKRELCGAARRPIRIHGDALSKCSSSENNSRSVVDLLDLVGHPSAEGGKEKAWERLFESFLRESKQSSDPEDPMKKRLQAERNRAVWDSVSSAASILLRDPVQHTVSNHRSSSIFAEVAEHLEGPALDIPQMRKASPTLSNAIELIRKLTPPLELLRNAGSPIARSAPIPVPGSLPQEVFAGHSAHEKEIKLRTAYTEIHNNAHFALDTASAFLGENLSVRKWYDVLDANMKEEALGSSTSAQEFPSGDSSPRSPTDKQENDTPSGFSEDPSTEGKFPRPHPRPTIKRSASLEELLKAGLILPSPSTAPTSIMTKMPPVQSRRELGDATKSIPVYAWILPYVVACAPPYTMQYLAMLPCVFGYNSTGRSGGGKGNSNSESRRSFGSISAASSMRSSSLSPEIQMSSRKFAGDASRPADTEYGGSSIPQSCQRAVRYPRAAPHWFSLGVVWCCKDPSWNRWEQRAVFVCHNYLFECMPDLQHGIVGYAQLSGSLIIKCQCSVMGSEDGSSGKSDSVGVCLSVLTASKFDAPRHTFWIRGMLPEDVHLLAEIIETAQDLTLEDVYEFPAGPEDEVILGRGRYNEVRKARRKDTAMNLYTFLNEVDKKVAHMPRPPMPTVTSMESIGISMHSVRSEHSGEDLQGGSNRCESQFNYDTKRDSSIFFVGDGELDPSLHDVPPPPHAEPGQYFDEDDEDDKDWPAGEMCALKLVSKEIFWKRVNLGKERADSLVREVLSQMLVCDSDRPASYVVDQGSISSSLHSSPDAIVPAAPYELPSRIPIVEIYNVFESLDGFAVELELMEHFDLFDKLSRDGIFSETAAQQVVLQLIDAIDICNRLGIAHRDIKLSNITFPLKTQYDLEEANELGLSDDQSLCIKLADFGMAGFVGRDNKLRGRCGTPGYVAPDILKAGMHEGYGINVDMFSIGVVAYTLLCGYEPFYGESSAAIFS